MKRIAGELADWTMAPRWALVVTIATLWGLFCGAAGFSLTLVADRFNKLEAAQHAAPTLFEAKLREDLTRTSVEVGYLKDDQKAADTRINKLIDLQTETIKLLNKIVDRNR